jgi:hypothetical protein
MQNFIGVFKLTSLGATYAAANILYADKQVELLELSPIANQGILIASGSEGSLNDFRRSLRQADLVRTSIVPDAEKKLLKTYLSLEFQNIQKYLLILESNFLGDIFDWSHQAITLGATLCDLRMLRTQDSPSFAFLTGQQPEQVAPLIKSLKQKNEKVTLIESPESGLVEFMSMLP